jgi:hypothetical protein
MSYSGSFDHRPRGSTAAVFALVIVIAGTLVGFHVTTAGVFEKQSTVRIHVGSQLASSRPIVADTQQVGETATLSVAPAAIPACNHQACTEAYRSFNAARHSLSSMIEKKRIIVAPDGLTCREYPAHSRKLRDTISGICGIFRPPARQKISDRIAETQVGHQ